MEILRKIYYSDMFRYIVTPTVGFGIAGGLWGLDIYRGVVGSNEAFINPFSFISGAFLFGILGSLSLVVFCGDLKKIGKVVCVGFIGWVVAFLLPLTVGYYLFIAGGIITPIIGVIAILTDIDLAHFLSLSSSVWVGHRWVEFMLSGAIPGLAYGLLFKKSIVRVSVVTGAYFSLGSFAGPIIGNSINILISHSFVIYLVTFSLIGGILGFTFGRILQEKIHP